MSAIPNLSVKIGSLTLRNPVMTGSGTFGFGSEMAGILDLERLGAIVVKSTSREPRLGNDTPRIVETPGGLLNAIGLQNGGVDNFIQEKLPFLRQFDVPIIVNLVGYSVEDYVYLAERLTEAEGADALEINISCPNVKHGCDFSVTGSDRRVDLYPPQGNATAAYHEIVTERDEHRADRASRRRCWFRCFIADQHASRHGRGHS